MDSFPDERLPCINDGRFEEDPSGNTPGSPDLLSGDTFSVREDTREDGEW